MRAADVAGDRDPDVPALVPRLGEPRVEGAGERVLNVVRAGAAGTVVRRAACRRRIEDGVPARAAQPCCAGPPRYQKKTVSATATVAAPATTRTPAVPSLREYSNGHRETDGRHAAEAEQREPARPRVAPRAEGMHERNRPRGVGEKVDDPPGAVADPRAHEARYEEREQEIERHGSEAQPDRPVR